MKRQRPTKLNINGKSAGTFLTERRPKFRKLKRSSRDREIRGFFAKLMRSRPTHYAGLFERRGRPRRWKSRNSVIALLFILGLIVWVSYSAKHDGQSQIWPLIHVAEVRAEIEASRSATLTEENAELTAKLERSAKIQTSDQTKALARFYIHKYFGNGEVAAQAEKVFTCESNLNNDAFNGSNTNGTADRGIPQINTVHAARFKQFYGVDWTVGAHDFDLSIKYAKFLYDHSGWNAWTCRKVL